MDGKLALMLETVSLRDKTLSLIDLGDTAQRNLLTQLSSDPQYSKVLSEIKKVEVSNGTIKLYKSR